MVNKIEGNSKNFKPRIKPQHNYVLWVLSGFGSLLLPFGEKYYRDSKKYYGYV